MTFTCCLCVCMRACLQLEQLQLQVQLRDTVIKQQMLLLKAHGISTSDLPSLAAEQELLSPAARRGYSSPTFPDVFNVSPSASQPTTSSSTTTTTTNTTTAFATPPQSLGAKLPLTPTTAADFSPVEPIPLSSLTSSEAGKRASTRERSPDASLGARDETDLPVDPRTVPHRTMSELLAGRGLEREGTAPRRVLSEGEGSTESGLSVAIREAKARALRDEGEVVLLSPTVAANDASSGDYTGSSPASTFSTSTATTTSYSASPGSPSTVPSVFLAASSPQRVPVVDDADRSRTLSALQREEDELLSRKQRHLPERPVPEVEDVVALPPPVIPPVPQLMAKQMAAARDREDDEDEDESSSHNGVFAMHDITGGEVISHAEYRDMLQQLLDLKNQNQQEQKQQGLRRSQRAEVTSPELHNTTYPTHTSISPRFYKDYSVSPLRSTSLPLVSAGIAPAGTAGASSRRRNGDSRGARNYSRRTKPSPRGEKKRSGESQRGQRARRKSGGGTRPASAPNPQKARRPSSATRRTKPLQRRYVAEA